MPENDTVEETIPQEPQDDRIRLFVIQPKEGQADSVTEVRWDITQKLRDDVVRRKLVNPQILIVVQSVSKRTYMGDTHNVRTQTGVFIRPLAATAEWVRFRRTGTNELRLLIVDAYNWDQRMALRSLKRKERVYNEQIFDEGGHLVVDKIGGFRYIRLNTVQPVVVPPEMFAKPLAPWKKKLTNRFFEGKLEDNCHTRKRLIFSGLMGIMLLTIGQVLKLAALCFGLFFGLRKLQWKSLFHPWKDGVFELFDETEGTIWFSDHHGHRKRSLLNVINPIVFTAAPAIVYAAMQVQAHNEPGKLSRQTSLAHQLSFPGWWFTVGAVDLGIVCLVLGLAFLFFAAMAMSWLVSRLLRLDKHKPDEDEIRRQRQAAQAKKEAARRNKLLSSLDDVVSSTGNKAPAPKQTIHLCYQELKRKVCKPYMD
jgi:hypothetical protein